MCFNWSVVGFVISSMLGCGIFITPACVLPNGIIGFCTMIAVGCLFLCMGYEMSKLKLSLFSIIEHQFG